MREIKFRGKCMDKSINEWLYGELTQDRDFDGKHVRIICKNKDSKFWGMHIEVNVETVGQYTGLKDKTGKEIYEGDIIDDGEHIYDIRWDADEARFMAANTLSSVFWVPMGWYDDFKVIGNIHETPELLEKEEWT